MSDNSCAFCIFPLAEIPSNRFVQGKKYPKRNCEIEIAIKSLK